MKFISCGIFDKAYIYFFLIYFIFVMLLLLTWGICESEIKIQNNIAFYMLFNNLGQILCFIPEKIIDKFFFKQKEKSNKSNNLFKKEKQSLAIELIFNDFSYKLTYVDLIYISCASLFLLITDNLNLFIQMKKDYTILLSEQYYFFLLLLLIVFSYLIYRIRFYKHQIYSISFIILLGIIRYLIKLIINPNREIIYILFEFVATFLESIAIVYIKGLMEFKFFSPYKICYVFGFINSIIIIIISIIFLFFIKYDNENCYFQGKEICYFENLFKKFQDLGILSFISIILFSIFYGILKLLSNIIINKYTIFHLFLFIQNREFTTCIFKEYKNILMSAIISISYLLEFFVILVFLEIIELNFWGLNENVKRKIKERADEEMRLSLTENENEERNPSYNSVDDNNNIE